MGEERRRAERPLTTGPQRRGTGVVRRRGRGPLTRTRSRVVAATTGLLGLSSARRAAVLAVVVCALALSVAVPLRNYVTQRQELAAVSEEQRELAAEVDALIRQRARLTDPAEVSAQARSRLGYVLPGQTPYVVQLPAGAAGGTVAGPATDVPWYRTLWREVAEGAP